MKIFLDANVCLDLLDSNRPTSTKSINWFLANKDNSILKFYFSSDFITTFYYILTEKRKVEPKKAILAIDLLVDEIIPVYIKNQDFLQAKDNFFKNKFNDFEDLIILNSANRIGCKEFITNDKKLLALKNFEHLKLISPTFGTLNKR
jgi:predicted nucleic-acid-binding protein